MRSQRRDDRKYRVFHYSCMALSLHTRRLIPHIIIINAKF